MLSVRHHPDENSDDDNGGDERDDDENRDVQNGNGETGDMLMLKLKLWRLSVRSRSEDNNQKKN